MSPVKKAVIFIVSLLLLAALAEGIILLQVRISPVPLAAFLACLSLVLGAFVAFTDSGFVRRLRAWALQSVWAALGMPLLLLVPYLVLAFGTGTFSARGLIKLAAYVMVPAALLLPDRLRRATRVGWRDFAAMLALAIPVPAHWLRGIWVWPEDLYFFQPLYSVCAGVYAFVVVRHLEGVGYRLRLRKGDLVDGLSNFVAFALLGIPTGYGLHFIHFHTPLIAPWRFQFVGMREAAVLPGGLALAFQFLGTFVGIYITIAIPEELLFRGVLQNFLVKSIPLERRGLWGLLVAATIFGLSHLHHPPVPNWRYAILATLAGVFYGNAYRTRQRLSASAFTHALVDATWHFWF